MAEHIYASAERPDVEVEVNGVWHPGELRGWWDRGGRRLMNVEWRPERDMTYLDTVPAERVRRV